MLKKKALKRSTGLNVRIQPVISARTAVRLEDTARKRNWQLGQTLDFLSSLGEDYEHFKAALDAGRDLKEIVANFVSAVTESIEIENLKK